MSTYVYPTEQVVENADSAELKQLASRLADTGYPEVAITVDKAADGTVRFEYAPVVKRMAFEGGVMVALYPPPAVAQAVALDGDGALDAADLHVTLAYLGKAENMEPRDIALLHAVVAECAAMSSSLRGSLTGVGRFSPGDDGVPVWAALDVAGLARFRSKMVDRLQMAGLPVRMDHDFTPHMTLAYRDEAGELPDVPDAPLTFGSVAVAVGGEATMYPLDRPGPVDMEMAKRADVSWLDTFRDILGLTPKGQPEVGAAKLRKSDEQMFTLGPWYVPNKEDAHGEWTGPDELQKALWEYVDYDDRGIRLQHDQSVVAGRWVEAMQWPFPVELDMTRPDGKVEKVEYPAGTVFLGVKWEPWAWQLVKAGRILGYSIGGVSRRVMVDLPTEEAS